MLLPLELEKEEASPDISCRFMGSIFWLWLKATKFRTMIMVDENEKLNHSSNINKTVLLLPPRLIVSRGSSLGSANSSFDSPTSNHAG